MSTAPATTVEDYAWDYAVNQAVGKLGQIIAARQEFHTDFSDFNPVDPNDTTCPIAPVGDRWMAEAGGAVLCLDPEGNALIGITLIVLTPDDLTGGPTTMSSPTQLGTGAVVDGCGPDACIAVWTAGPLQVFVRGEAGAGGAAARALLETNLTGVLDQTANLDLDRIEMR